MKIIMVVGDVTDENVQNKLVNDTVNHFGRLDVLVTNTDPNSVLMSYNSTVNCRLIMQEFSTCRVL